MRTGERQAISWPTKRWMLSVVASLFLTAALQSASALAPEKAITQYVHTVWRTDDGLPENSVTRILETSNDYLWVGTQAGLARFDGVRFTVFDHTNTPSLHSDRIDDLVEDRRGTLWIAISHGGLVSYRDGLFSRVSAIGDRAALALAADADGSVWVGGYGGLAHVLNGRVLATYTAADGLSGDPVTHLLMDKDKSLWVATAGGLDRIVNGKIHAYSIADGLPNNDVTGLYLDHDDTLWIRTQNSELTRRIHDRFEPWSMPDVSGATVHDMLEDRDGNIWLASSTQGLLRINGKQLSRFTASDGLSGDQVDCLYEDREGNLWVGTNGGGLDRFRDGSFTTYAKEEGLAANSSFSVIEDMTGDIWITTAGGLNRLHGNQSRLYAAADGVPDDVTSLWVDRTQSLWIGTATHGVFRMTDGRVAQALSVRDGVPAYVISGIIEDSKNQLWFSTLGGGLVRYAGGQTSLYTRANGLQSNVLCAITIGANGTIWIGTNGGLNSIQDGRVQNYAAKDGPSNAWILSLYFDSSGILWIGTAGRGLFRFVQGGFTQYSVQQGLPDDTINSILEDAQSNLWVGSNKGIFRISRHDLDAVAQGASQSVYPVVFGKPDGMKSSETDAGTQPTAWRARDGRLWFLTTRGVVVVDPAHLSFDGRLPQSRIEAMLAEQTQVNMIQPLQLAPGTHRLEFRYTAPTLSAPERTRFRYRLDGIDSQWVPSGTQRVAQYTNMSPGRYTFRVEAGSTTGGWSAQEASIGFAVLPYFYQTTWFRCLCVLAGVALLWSAYRLRVGWLHARAAVLEERQRIASEIHDGLAQGLSGIVFQTEAALLSMKRAPGMTSTHVAAARDLAESSLDDARYSVWSLSPPVLDQKNLLESLSSMARQFARGRVEELDIHSSGTAWSMRPEARHHIVLVAQEAISNAIQHGNAHRIAIDVTFAPEALHLTVSDDGIGFDPELSVEQPKRGYGTRNMRHRAERLGATLGLTSEIGKGTTVSLCLPRIGILARLWRGLRGDSIARIDG